ncbi:MAG: DUF1273 domain-containing protein [Oscillospiraceae bacterium]|nr:DUF1273 domain-containing protein [Oscillospiraceae bacterium]
MFRVSFTGHRPEKLPFFGEDDPLCVELKKRLRDQIEQLIEDGAEEFCTGMARGVDIWAAELVLELKSAYPGLRLTAVIPCPEQADRWVSDQKTRYQSILEQCDKAITTSPSYTKGCMQKRNKALVDMCDVLVAVFDGTRGGTMQTVNYAKSKGRKTIVIPPV